MQKSSALPNFREYVKDHVIVADGAMATVLHQSGVPVRTCYESLCLSNPTLVANVHRSYVRAGAKLIQTNTFSAHRAGLSRYGLESQLSDVNLAAAHIAIDAAAGEAYVFGTIGSIRDFLVDPSDNSVDLLDMIRDQVKEQAMVLLSAPIHGILLETFADLEECKIAIDTVRGLTDLPIIANLSPLSVGVTRDGYKIDEAFAIMQQAGADVVGLNCQLGPTGILHTFERIQLEEGLTYAAVPNAGKLHMVEGDYSYTGSEGYFSDIALEIQRLGVHVIGGCCGTTPQYIASLVQKLGQEGVINHPAQVVHKEHSARAEQHTGTTRLIESPTPRQPTLVERVREDITVIVELDPPKSLEMSQYLAGARELKEAGADYVTIADNSLGAVRVGNMAVATLLKNEGIEPLVHVACRDRNLIGQQSHLMGLNVLDIHHVLLVTGDPTKFGDLPGASSVYDVSSMELTRMVKRLNLGISFSGETMKHPSSFTVGTSFNPHVINFDKAIERLHRKVEAGADYVMTQPMYEIEMFERIARATESLGVPVFVGVMPIVSERNATFLHNEVPGIRIPKEIMFRIRDAGENATMQGIQIASELIDEALKYFNGIYLVTPFLKFEMTVALTKHIRQVQKLRQSDLFDFGEMVP